MQADFELRLIEALQPIRGFAVAQAIYHSFATGLFDCVVERARTIDDLARDLHLDRTRLAGFLQYLTNENLVTLCGDVVALTPRARALLEFRPWYELLIGGYAETFQQLTDALRGGGYSTRNGALVGRGSCGISQHDVLPMFRNLLADLPRPPSEVVDLGCGDGQFLASFITAYPGARGTGVDPFAPLSAEGERLTFLRTSASDYVRSLPEPEAGSEGRSLYIAAFLLHELLQQEGRCAVVQLVGNVLRHGNYLAVVEVDHRPSDPKVMRHGLGTAYYNPYYLLHTVTEQRLESHPFWMELFREAGACVLSQQTTDARVDSTGLEFACLLRSEAAISFRPSPRL